VDDAGRVLTISDIKRDYNHDPKYVNDQLEKGNWKFEFYRMESEPAIAAILMQFADQDKLDLLPEEWQAQYAALRNVYLHGAPHEQTLSNEDQRWSSLGAMYRELERLEVNARQIDNSLGGPFGKVQEGTSRVFNGSVISGEAELFLQSDEGHRFLSQYRAFLDRIRDEFPVSPEYFDVMNYDPKTGVPFDRVEYEIPREKGQFVEITVADGHLNNPLYDTRYKPVSLVVPKISAAKLKKIEQGYPVVLKGKQSGRLYHAGPVEAFTKLPASTDPSFRDYYAQAQSGYEDESGQKFPTPSQRNIITIQELMPIANSRDVDPLAQSLRVPSAYFDALVSPHLAHRQNDIPMTGMVMMDDQLHQNLEIGEPIRFRECEGSMHVKLTGDEGVETGHIYESEKLKSVSHSTFGELKKRVLRWQDKTAQKYGFAGKQDMIDKINQVFIDRRCENPDTEEVVLVEFDRVKTDSWAYFNPAEAPKAAFTVDGRPTPPSAYRWIEYNASAGNDNTDQPAPVHQVINGNKPS
jgi:hypothetical protein